MPNTTITAASFNDLAAAIATANAAAAGNSYTITLGSSITETANLPALQLASGVAVTIDGGGHTLDGSSAYRGLFVNAGAVTVRNLGIDGTVAQGGNVGGGGGLGAGGDVFVQSGGSLTIEGGTLGQGTVTGGGGGQPG